MVRLLLPSLLPALTPTVPLLRLLRHPRSQHPIRRLVQPHHWRRPRFLPASPSIHLPRLRLLPHGQRLDLLPHIWRSLQPRRYLRDAFDEIHVSVSSGVAPHGADGRQHLREFPRERHVSDAVECADDAECGYECGEGGVHRGGVDGGIGVYDFHVGEGEA